MKYVYHYHAQRQTLQGVEHLDGLVALPKPITGNTGQWLALKAKIGGGSHAGLVVCSLSLVSCSPNQDGFRQFAVAVDDPGGLETDIRP